MNTLEAVAFNTTASSVIKFIFQKFLFIPTFIKANVYGNISYNIPFF